MTLSSTVNWGVFTQRVKLIKFLDSSQKLLQALQTVIGFKERVLVYALKSMIRKLGLA
jgi:hypothetical protein